MENLLKEIVIIKTLSEFLSGEMIVKMLSFFSNFVIRDFEKQTRKSKMICNEFKSPALHIYKALSVNIPTRNSLRNKYWLLLHREMEVVAEAPCSLRGF